MEAHCLFPPPDLVPFLDRVWGWHSSKGEWVDLPLLGPGVGAELVFILGSPMHAAFQPLPPILLFNQIGRAIPLDRQQDLDIVALRIRAGALRHSLPCPVEELPEGLQDAEAIWGLGIRRLHEALGQTQYFPQRAHLLFTWMREQRDRHLRPDPAMRRVIEGFYSRPNNPTLCLQESGLGVRQLQRRFKQATGISPKAFHQKLRLYRILRACALDPSTRMLDLALDQGFFDQPHFCHTFQQVTGLSPGDYLKEMQSRSHFYNPPRPSLS